MFLLTLLVSIEERHISLASSPEHVVGAAELYGGVNGVLYLQGSASHDVEVGIGGCAVHVALVREHVGCAPEQLDVRALHLLEGVVGDGFEVSLVFVDVVRRIDEVDVVEAEIFYAELLHYLEASVHLVLGTLESVVSLVPFVGAWLSSELVG